MNNKEKKAWAIIYPTDSEKKAVKSDMQKLTSGGVNAEYIHHNQQIICSDVTEMALIDSLCKESFGLTKSYNVAIVTGAEFGRLKISDAVAYARKKGALFIVN
jgi:hypothetical protein